MSGRYRQSGNEWAFRAALEDGERFSLKTGEKEAFGAALADRGIAFAIVIKDEAEKSRKEAAFARVVGNYAPKFKGGEIVLVTEPRLEYRRNGELTEPRRVHQLDQSLAEKFVKTLGNRGELKGIEATKQVLDKSYEERTAKWEALRLTNATRNRGRTSVKEPNLLGALGRSSTTGANVFGRLGKGFHALSDAFDSLISPTLSPEQIYQSEIAKLTREVEAEQSIDLSRYTRDAAQQRQNHQEQQAARDRQRELERER